MSATPAHIAKRGAISMNWRPSRLSMPPQLGTDGRAEGRAEGIAEGRAEARAQMVRQILRSRGIAVSARFSTATAAFAAASEEALLAAALGCADEAGFIIAALRRARDQGG